MNADLSSIPDIVLNYVQLQESILSVFAKLYPCISDPSTLYLCPKKGSIIKNGEKWFFVRHGGGFTFTESDKKTVVSPHRCPHLFRAVDAWRLHLYLESICESEDLCPTEKDIKEHLAVLLKTNPKVSPLSELVFLDF